MSDLQTAADDLDRLEELEPRPGRVGLANRLRRPNIDAALEARFNYIVADVESVTEIIAAAFAPPGDTDDE